MYEHYNADRKYHGKLIIGNRGGGARTEFLQTKITKTKTYTLFATLPRLLELASSASSVSYFRFR